MYNKGDIFDKYSDTSEPMIFWHRIRNGERVIADWINISDFEKDLSTIRVFCKKENQRASI
jgi:hypothetical protein